jgi:hypothetical protein
MAVRRPRPLTEATRDGWRSRPGCVLAGDFGLPTAVPLGRPPESTSVGVVRFWGPLWRRNGPSLGPALPRRRGRSLSTSVIRIAPPNPCVRRVFALAVLLARAVRGRYNDQCPTGLGQPGWPFPTRRGFPWERFLSRRCRAGEEPTMHAGEELQLAINRGFSPIGP